MNITPSSARTTVDPTGHITGDVQHLVRTMGDLQGVFSDVAAYEEIPADTVAYRVESFMPIAPGTPGGLFFGTSFVEPGTVGGEYYMTRGHFHESRDASEMYWGIAGSGYVVMQSESGDVNVEAIEPGSVHYVPGRWAHRVVNTGNTQLVVGACWPADAGHDYAALAQVGFGVRIISTNGSPKVVANEADPV